MDSSVVALTHHYINVVKMYMTSTVITYKLTWLLMKHTIMMTPLKAIKYIKLSWIHLMRHSHNSTPPQYS